MLRPTYQVKDVTCRLDLQRAWRGAAPGLPRGRAVASFRALLGTVPEIPT
jgi:hypothetical protein